MVRRTRRKRKGQSLVEYSLLLAGVSLACIVGVSLVGEKTADMIAAVATVLPGADGDDNGPIAVGHLIESTPGSAGAPISLDVQTIAGKAGQARLGQNYASNSGDGFGGLVVDPVTGAGS